MIKHKVLFVGSRNGSRSFMVEVFCNFLSDDNFEAESAGFDAGCLDPMAVEVMLEIGINISRESTKTVFFLFKEGEMFRALSLCATARTTNVITSIPATSTTLTGTCAIRNSWMISKTDCSP